MALIDGSNSYEAYKHEESYIESVPKNDVGHNFNHDPLCFARYITMQAKSAKKAGFPLIAANLMNHRDTILNMNNVNRIEFEKGI